MILSVTPGARSRSRATSAGSSASRWRSLAAMAKVVRQRAGSKVSEWAKRSSSRSKSRARAASASARAVATMPRPDLTNRASPTIVPELADEMADRRLGDAEPLRGAGDGAGLDDRDQEPQQPRVEIRPIEIAHAIHDDPCIVLWQWRRYSSEKSLFQGGTRCPRRTRSSARRRSTATWRSAAMR